MNVIQIGTVVANGGDMGIKVDSKYKDALYNIEDFAHLQVIWWFSESEKAIARGELMLTEDAPYKNGPAKLGVFATRSPMRPNPIAVTTVTVTHIDWSTLTLYVEYIDAFDGTPVLDIKPYTPSLDRIQSPKMPAWCGNWPASVEESGDFDWGEVFNF